jgi:hypothetical protein
MNFWQWVNFNLIASSVVDKATDEAYIVKNPAAVALGRLGVLRVARLGLRSVSPERRKEIAVKAPSARWCKV